jgi:hypothetical protein
LPLGLRAGAAPPAHRVGPELPEALAKPQLSPGGLSLGANSQTVPVAKAWETGHLQFLLFLPGFLAPVAPWDWSCELGVRGLPGPWG